MSGKHSIGQKFNGDFANLMWSSCILRTLHNDESLEVKFKISLVYKLSTFHDRLTKLQLPNCIFEQYK